MSPQEIEAYHETIESVRDEERMRCANLAELFYQTEFARTGEPDAPVYRMQTIGLCIGKAIRDSK